MWLSACRESWQLVLDARFRGGTRQRNVASIAACLELCMSTDDCHAADYNAGQNDCWIHTDRADLTQTVAAPGWRQYLQLSQCGALCQLV